MPTKREREYYRMGFADGAKGWNQPRLDVELPNYPIDPMSSTRSKPKRKLSAWNKFVKANSNKKIYKYANGKLKLKKMGIAFRKTRAGRKK